MDGVRSGERYQVGEYVDRGSGKPFTESDPYQTPTTNIATVARNTGIPEQVVRSVRQHVFFDEHSLLDGTVRRFDADGGVAVWWKAATGGGIPQAELERVQLLFAHEYVERCLIQSGMPYRLSETGVPMAAHELAPRAEHAARRSGILAGCGPVGSQRSR